MKFIVLVLAISCNSLVLAATCSNLNECIQLTSKLTNKKYLLDSDVKGSVKLSKNFDITKDTADDFISEVLALNGYTRIKTSDTQWTVINARDIRYHLTPMYV